MEEEVGRVRKEGMKSELKCCGGFFGQQCQEAGEGRENNKAMYLLSCPVGLIFILISYKARKTEQWLNSKTDYLNQYF